MQQIVHTKESREPEFYDYGGDIYKPSGLTDEYGYKIYANSKGFTIYQSLHDKMAWRNKQIRQLTKRRLFAK